MNIDGGNATLTNVDNTIAGSGTIGSNASGSLTFVNKGSVSATSSSPLSISTGASVTNDGVLEASGGKLNVSDAVTGAGYAVVANGGRISFSGAFNQNVSFLGPNAGTLRLPRPLGSVRLWNG